MVDAKTAEAQVARFADDVAAVRAQVGRVIVGQAQVVDGVLTCLLGGGHALLEGVPGLGKTSLVRAMSQALDLRFSRIQFTPDLMPADIVGTTVMQRDESQMRLEFQPGPIFSQIVLADEVNRATPKTQSALLEVMQEHSVTVGRTTHRLEEPYFVLATQNPLEMEGTYPLPEAQLDRFLLKLTVPFPSRDELHQILERTTSAEVEGAEIALGQARILEMRRLVREVVVADHVRDYVVRLLLATHPGEPSAPESVKRYVRFGASPRGAQACLIAAKVTALCDRRHHVATDDIVAMLKPALRHRVILNFEGEAEDIDTDVLLDDVLAHVPEQV